MSHARPAVVRRYAQALYDQLGGPDDATVVLQALQDVADLWASSEELQKLLRNPAVAVEERLDTLSRLLRGGIPGHLRDMLRMVLERRRHAVIPLLPSTFADVMDEHDGVKRVTVISATPLQSEQRRALQALAAKLAGHAVRLYEQVDPAIIGGVRLRIGDRLVDISLQGQLQRLVKNIVDAPVHAPSGQEGGTRVSAP